MEEVKTNKKAEPTLVNVSTIGNEYTKEQLQQYNREKKQIIFKRRRLTVIFTVAAIFFVLSGFNLISGYRHISQLEKEKVAALREKEELEKNEKSLRYSVDLLKDEEYLQKVARQKFFYTKDGELVYSLPQAGSGVVDDAKSGKDKKESKKDDNESESNTDSE